jgi:undecaprenyl-diphosphatase
MTPFQSIVLGVIQGATEFLPISSTAHLKIVPVLLGWPDPGSAFSAVIQWGTFVACVMYFRADLAKLLAAFFRDLCAFTPFASQESRLAWLIGLATLPICLAGFFLKNYINGPFRSLYVMAGAMIVLALLLIVAEWYARRREGKEMERIGWFEPLVVGLAQVFALIPGASRSGTTITGGLFAGLSREAAARFSFLLSLPAIFAAGLYELDKEREVLLASSSDITNLLLATLVSGIVGYGCIAFLLHYLKTRTMTVFIVYRIGLGVLLLGLIFAGVLNP